MTKNEAAIVVSFLEELSDHFSTDGCNDMYLENNPENVELITKSYEEEGADLILKMDKTQFCVNNILILIHLKNKLVKEYGLGN